ncbi:MAG: NAD(P)H-dependent oxidoreductase [Candidatus Marinimicrobia bacterium]|nr:NAD(P)H-dependent oxidoreductase [Candidatus Neomarinimicrobiota bacterium]
MHLIISTSLRPDCRTLSLAKKAYTLFSENNAQAEIINLETMNLPFCDGGDCYKDQAVIDLTNKIKVANSLIIASPVYNYYLNAVAKNLLELTGSGWNDKVVGFICNAGGDKSFMSVMPFANSIMLDYRCKVIPKFVYATGDMFEGKEVIESNLTERINELVKSILSQS